MKSRPKVTLPRLNQVPNQFGLGDKTNLHGSDPNTQKLGVFDCRIVLALCIIVAPCRFDADGMRGRGFGEARQEGRDGWERESAKTSISDSDGG